MDAERAHHLALAALRWELPWAIWGRGSSDDRLRTDLCGIALDNPVGLAPGFDKNAQAIGALSRLGFGYLVVGSITREPRVGNPRPRLLRDVPHEGIINTMGLPNDGIEAVAKRLQRAGALRVPVMASVAGFNSAELLELAEAVQPHVAAVEIGLICPNTTHEERLDELGIFGELASGLRRIRTRPIFMKLPTFHTPDEEAHVLRMAAMCQDAGIDGVSVHNTLRVRDARLSRGEGSIAGRPVFEESLRAVAAVADHTGGRLAIKGSGGVSTGTDARAMISAGATTVEVYSSFVYRGWAVARKLNAELLRSLDEDRITSVAALRAGLAPRAAEMAGA